MLSKKKIICPDQLLKLAKAKGPVKVVIANAGVAEVGFYHWIDDEKL